MAEKLSLSEIVNLKRKSCLKELFSEARRKNCLLKRVENKNKNFVSIFATEIVKRLNERNKGFQRSFEICTLNSNTFEIFTKLNLGETNPSIYLFKVGKTQGSIALEAETKQIWRNTITKEEYLCFWNSNNVKVQLHVNLSNVLKDFSVSETWKQLQKNSGLHSIEVSELSSMKICLGNFNNRKIRTIKLYWYPTVIIPEFCLPYAKSWLGQNIPCLVGKNNRLIEANPELQWKVSYHVFENTEMQEFPMKVSLEAFYGTLNFIKSDSVLKILPRDIICHVFFEITNHIRRWLDANYQDYQELNENDCSLMMEFFFRNLLQKLQSKFVSNYFNPEIDLLRMTNLTSNQIELIIGKLKVILRGNCECCREKIKKRIANHNGISSTETKTKKLSLFKF